MSSSTEIVTKYFDAWNAHDGEAVLATYNEGGTYIDSSLEAVQRGAEIAEYVKALCTLFPDMRLELVSNAESSTGVIAAPWLLFGTDNGGGFGGNAPTGKSVILPGCDFIRVSGGKIDSVAGLFDVGVLAKALS